MEVANFKLTKVYKLAFEQAMDIFEVTKTFPREEKYSLIDQIRRSYGVSMPTLEKHIAGKNIRHFYPENHRL
jgi:hypothetical protein